MEESSEVQYQDNKSLPENNKRRRFKTPSQLQALEDFYNEHKYPTELMKAELAEKLGLTEKQISGWFCHRRLKDKRKDEVVAPGRHDLSSGVIQDRGSGLKQDSCSSTKQGDNHIRVPDVREVESRRFNLPAADLNYEPRRPFDGAETEMDDTSSESNSALHKESFCPQNRNPLDVEKTPEYRAPNGFIAKPSGRVGPSGYLKIKGQTENASITAVKRQLGRNYREDGPPLGIEFDPLPPGAFESPPQNTKNEAYRIQEPIASGSLDMSGTCKRPGFSTMRDQETYVEATEHRTLHKPNQDNFSYHQPKQKHSFPNDSRVLPIRKSSNGVDSYSARETLDYDRSMKSMNHGILHKHDVPGMRSDSFSDNRPRPYRGKLTSEVEEPWLPSYDNVNHKVVRRWERLDSRPAAPVVRRKDPVNIEDRVPSTRILKECKDEEPYVERRLMTEHHDSVRIKARPTKDFRAGKRGREEFLQEDYAIRTSSQELPPWLRHKKGSTAEIPSSFSEDETAETCSLD